MSRKKIAIIGAGISGLSLAWFLNKKSPDAYDIFLFEEKERVGGWMHTHRHNGHAFELGPRTLRPSDCLLQLIEDLGIQDAIVRPQPYVKTRYLAHEGKLRKLPGSLVEIVTSPLGRIILKGVVRSLFFRPQGQKDLSVSAFFQQRYGKEFTAACIDPLTAGIYAAAPQALSMQSCFPDLFYNKGGLFSSRQKGLQLFSFQEGMGFLPQILASKLHASIYLNTAVRVIHSDGNNVIVDTDHKAHEVDWLVCATSPQQLSKLCPDVSALAMQIPMTSVATVSAGFYEEMEFPQGFGFLCASSQEPALLGVIFDSCLFPQNGLKTRFSFMLGGQKDPAALLRSDEELQAEAMRAARKYLNIHKTFDEMVVMRASDSIARYPVGHAALTERIEQHLCKKRISLAGAGFYGVSVGDCIASANKLSSLLDEKI